MMTELTERQIELMRHALGLDNSDRSHRNYYSVPPDMEADLEWAAMCAASLARLYLFGEKHNYYEVTEAGRIAVAEAPQAEVRALKERGTDEG